MERKTVVKVLNYGLEISDDPNYPENSIYILGSYGQSGHCSLVIVLTAVDGGIYNIPAVVRHIPYGKKLFKEIPSEIRKVLTKIHKKFVPDCPFLNAEDISEIILRWNDLWEY
jgi:hypothetical protein